MPTTPKGITYPDQNGHVRIWEHLQTLATNADAISFFGVDVQPFTASGTWTKPAGAIVSWVKLVGAGGGGGGAPVTGSGTAAAAAGGGGGGFSEKWIAAATLGATEAVTIGSGGTGAAAGNNIGGAGGTTSFGAHASATGGGGGQGMTASATTTTGGGAGGVGSGGQINIDGQEGLRGRVVTGGIGDASYGGASHLSTCSPVATASASGAGQPGKIYGGGGSGGLNFGVGGTPAQPGGAGADGYCVVVTLTA